MSGDQMPSLLGRKRQNNIKCLNYAPRGGCWSFDLTSTLYMICQDLCCGGLTVSSLAQGVYMSWELWQEDNTSEWKCKYQTASRERYKWNGHYWPSLLQIVNWFKKFYRLVYWGWWDEVRQEWKFFNPSPELVKFWSVVCLMLCAKSKARTRKTASLVPSTHASKFNEWPGVARPTIVNTGRSPSYFTQGQVVKN